MFSALNQGSIVYILDKSNGIKYRQGNIISVSLPKVDYSNPGHFGYLNTTLDLKVDIDGSTFEYNAIPSSYSVITYNNGKVTISETKEGLLNEVESILQNRKSVLSRLDEYKLDVVDCEEILKQLNPQFAKDAERDQRLNTLELKFNGVEDKLDRIINLVNKEKL